MLSLNTILQEALRGKIKGASVKNPTLAVFSGEFTKNGKEKYKTVAKGEKPILGLDKKSINAFVNDASTTPTVQKVAMQDGLFRGSNGVEFTKEALKSAVVAPLLEAREQAAKEYEEAARSRATQIENALANTNNGQK